VVTSATATRSTIWMTMGFTSIVSAVASGLTIWMTMGFALNVSAIAAKSAIWMMIVGLASLWTITLATAPGLIIWTIVASFWTISRCSSHIWKKVIVSI